MYRKILVPIDGSEMAECALEHVRTIAKGCKVPDIILLFVAEHVSSGLYQSSEEAKGKLVAWGKDVLARAEKRLANEGIAVRSVLLEGNPAEVIINYAAKNEIDLIVMSTHGHSGITRWAFGSVANKVINSSPVPVLISIPKGCRIQPYS